MKKKKFIFYCEVIYSLDLNAETCIRAASDFKTSENECIPVFDKILPNIGNDKDKKKTKYLPKRIINEILELKIYEKQAERIIKNILDFELQYDPMTYFSCRQIYLKKIGIKSLIISEKLKKLAKIPRDRFHRGKESSLRALKELWRINLKTFKQISK